MEILKNNKTRKIITIFAVGLGILIAINVVMGATSFAGEDIHRETIEPYLKDDVNHEYSGHVDNKYRVTIDADHLATGKNYNNYYVKFKEPAVGYCKFRYKDVWMRVKGNHVDVFYCTYREELEPLIHTDGFPVNLGFSMMFSVYDAKGNKIDEFLEKTEWREDKYDNRHDQDDLTFHANGGKDGSDFIRPEKPFTAICNELVNRGITTREFVDNTSLEELIKYGYVKITLVDLHMTDAD